MPQKESLLGYKGEFFEVIDGPFKDPTNYVRPMWKCLCVCGKEFFKNYNCVKRAISCGCKQYDYYENRENLKHRNIINPQDSAYSCLYVAKKADAKRRGLEFSLTKEEAINLFKGNCFHCGCIPHKEYFPYMRKDGKTRTRNVKRCRECSVIVNGIDRLNSNLGYFKENCVSCCMECNVAKNSLSLSSFNDWINKVYNFKKRGINMEKVLVFPKSVLEILQPFNGFTKNISILSNIRFTNSLFYMEREKAENNLEFLQLIPYCILKKGNLVFTYQRTKSGGESRLHDKFSLGVGGHICQEFDGDTLDSYQKGLERELKEEVGLIGKYENKVLGLLWNDETPVNAVHMGVVHEINLLEDAKMEFRDKSLDLGQFVLYNSLSARLEQFESWSQLVIKELL